jgi:hypothetical protein
MSNYTKSTNFATKDNLTPGDPLKIVRGTEIDTEFNNIATAIATKTDNASAAITGGTINDTTIGATTASTGAFTTLAASGNVTLSGGTANGVAYLNGSKVVTSGSALVFDGTNFGVGTSSPSYKLDVQGASGVGIQLYETSTGNNNRLRITQTAGITNYLSTYSSGSTNAQTWSIGGSELMRLDSSGNLGLGVTPSGWGSGQKAIQIGATGALYTPADRYLSLGSNFYDNGTNGIYLTTGHATNYQQNRTSGVHAWYNAPSGTAGNAITFTQAKTLTAGGDLLVGTTSAATGSVGAGFQVQNNSGTGSTINIGHPNGASSGFSYALFSYDNSIIGSIGQSGTTAVLFNTTSDQRLKENITDADSASTLIDALQVRKFDWKSDNSHQRYGFVAQELVTVAPEAVHQPEDTEQMMGVDYSKLVPMLVKEIQSLRQRVAQLESN